MMTPSNGNLFLVTGHLCGEFTGDPYTGQWRGALMFSLICIWINGWVNNREAGDLRRYRAHYDVIVTWLVLLSMFSDILDFGLNKIIMIIWISTCELVIVTLLTMCCLTGKQRLKCNAKGFTEPKQCAQFCSLKNVELILYFFYKIWL